MIATSTLLTKEIMAYGMLNRYSHVNKLQRKDIAIKGSFITRKSLQISPNIFHIQATWVGIKLQ